MAVEDANNYGLTGAQVKEMVAQTKKRAVSVGEDGSSHVEEADQIYTKTLQLQEAEFIFRTTAGDLSVETGSADLLAIKGHTVQEGHVDASVVFNDIQFADENTTIAVTNMGNLVARMATMGWEGEFRLEINSSGYVNLYQGWESSTPWMSNIRLNTLNEMVGMTITGDVAEGDKVYFTYVALVIGTLTTAKPTSFIATGYNQYDATAGYAHVIGGKEYRVDGTYTSLGFTETEGGTTTVMTVINDRFTPESDGYVYPSGTSGDLLIALVWTGTRDNDPYEAFSKTTITIPTIDKDSNSLPTATYGMPSVHDVADELNFADKLYIQRIGHYAYSAENLETVEALGVDYWYDEEDIFYVLETPIKYKLADSVRGEYTANDYGTEEFVGTSVSVGAMLTYGNNLVDKLRNLLDIQSIGDKLELNGSELNVAQSALGDVGAAKVLTTADYNANRNNWSDTNPENFNTVALWKVEPGAYYAPAGIQVNISTSSSSAYGHTYIVLRGQSSISVLQYWSGNNLFWYYITSTGSESNYTKVLLGSDTVKDLTSTTTYPLAANQGKILNDKITPSTGSGAPTTATVGIVGKIYVDTDTDTAYMCTKVSGGEYTWKQITA